MRHATFRRAVHACVVIFFIAAAGPASAYTITVDPLPTLTFPEKASPRTASGGTCASAPCPPKKRAR